MKRARRAAVGVGFAVALVVLLATAAAAHANLESSTPAQSAHYGGDAPPRSVTLAFDDNVTVTPKSIAVYDGRGRAVAVDARAGSHVTDQPSVGLARLGDGTYVVVWHVVSDDGHPEQGAFTFSVGSGGVTTADIGSLLSERAAGRPIGLAFGVDRLLAFLACLVLAGGLTFATWRWPEAVHRRDTRRALMAAAAVALVTTVAAVPLDAAYANGGGASTLFERTALGDVLDARYGRAAALRVGLIVVLAAIAVAPLRRRWLARGASLVAGVGLLATIAYAGHGDTGRFPSLGVATDLAHLGGAALWLGGMALLVFALRERPLTPDTAIAAKRFARLALPAVAVVVASGAVQGWRQTATWSALWHTGYGRLLIVKVLVVLAIVVVASAARVAVRGRGNAGSGTAADLRHGVWIEAVLAVVVVAVTAALVVTPPAREAVAAAQRPLPRTLHLDTAGRTLGYAVLVQPALAGENTIVVTPRLVASTGFLPATLTGAVRPATSAGAAAGKAITFTPLLDGRWVGTATFTAPGSWQLDLTGATSPATDTASVSIAVR